MLKIPVRPPCESEQPTKKSVFDLCLARPSLSDVSVATASSHTALLVMVAHAGSASSQVSPPEETILNHTVAVGAAVVGTVGLVGAVVVGAAVGPQSQRHWSLELHP